MTLPVTPRFIVARDGTRLRTALFEAPATRGLCVLLQGQTEFIEKYGEVIGELNRRGFSVATFDWRSQGGSGRLLDDAMKVHVARFAQYDDDLESFLEQVVAPRGQKPIVLAHSMGGHNLIRALHVRPEAFAAAAFSAPMLGLPARDGIPPWLAKRLSRLAASFGFSERYAPGMAGRDPLNQTFERQNLTSDRFRFERTLAILKADPSLRVGGPTWGWVAAAYASIAEVNARGYAEAIKTPVLLAGAGRDRVVAVEADRAFARRLPNARYVEFADSEHEILMENDSIRARFWSAFDDFVAGL
jgi:lysophospholipase